MNRIKFVFLSVVLAAVFSTAALGQQVADRFSSKDECVSAVSSGSFNYYNPSFTDGHRAVNTGEIIIPLEERACVHLKIVGRQAWVPQAKGTRYIFKGDHVVAREDCGNTADDLEYIPVAEAPSAATETAVRNTTATEPPVRNTTNNADFVSAPVVDEYRPISRNTTVVSNTTNVVNTSTINTTTTVVNPKPEKGDGWCDTYTPGAKTLWLGGYIGKFYGCHTKAAVGLTLAAAGGVVGIAYATNSLWWSGNASKPGTAPGGQWDPKMCALWAVGGPYYGNPPGSPRKPNECF